MATINIKTAALILERAFKESSFKDDIVGNAIDEILKGTHKTYRYILVTALLAKTENGNVNILALQKGDGKGGKYDARSLCHKVVVPFETLKLPHCLGGSNEPFLNKPARFVMLSPNNAVRTGKDRQTLLSLIDALSQIKTSKQAYIYLKSAMFRMKKNHEDFVTKFSIGDAVIDLSGFAQFVLDYVYAITNKTLEGEVCPLIVAQLEKMYLGRNYRVEPHKVNESGSSSKETGDIDIYDKKGTLVYSIEVKDKDFTVQDVMHAVAKFREASLSNSLFVYGKNVSFDEKAVFAALKEIGRNGHFCCLISILNYAKLRIADLKSLTINEFVDGLLQFARVINAKDDTVNEIKKIAKTIFED